MSIRFSDAAANEVVNQLELTATALLTMCATIEADIPVTVEDFHGRFRHTFDYESARHAVGLRGLATSLHQTAVVVRTRQYEALLARIAEYYRQLEAEAAAR